MNELLITDTDFRLYCPIAHKVDFERFVSSILKAQRGEIRSFLGRGLYRDLHVNQSDANYVSLLDGGTFTWQGQTVDFFGLKPAIVFYAYAHFMNDNDLRVTRTGNKILQSDVSEQATPEMMEAEYQKALNDASKYLIETAMYLDSNASTYPLWKGEGNIATRGTVVSVVRQAEYGRGYFGNNNGFRRDNYDY